VELVPFPVLRGLGSFSSQATSKTKVKVKSSGQGARPTRATPTRNTRFNSTGLCSEDSRGRLSPHLPDGLGINC
jgi:hypothetical protein